jgi:hypothetical protein
LTARLEHLEKKPKSERVILTRQEALALRRLRAEVDRARRRSAKVPTTEKQKHEAPDATSFIEFRRKLIQFLNLPPDVRESALRKVLERSSPHLYKNYLARAWDE